MERETITLDGRAQRRLLVITNVLADELTVEEAAVFLGISSRQMRRVLAAYRSEGPGSLIHGNRDRPPSNRLPDEHRRRLAELARTTYAGFNAEHLADVLADEMPHLAVPVRTLRRVLGEEGIAPSRTRRRAAHRSRRERMPRAGMLLQADGSVHDWLEGRGPRLTLIGGIDDATGELTAALFREHEDAAGYLEMLERTVRTLGLPLALYTDRHGIFVKDPGRPPTLAEQLAGRRSTTQVGRALEDCGVRWIGARSPQAKGRVERSWGTAQDRLVSELRRAGADDLATANRVLARYLARHNERFAVPPMNGEPAWRPWSSPWPVESVLCFHYPRRVANDATIPWEGDALGLPRRSDGRSWAGRRIIVEERLDGSLWARTDDGHHRLRHAPPSAPALRARRRRELDATSTTAPLDILVEHEPPPASPSTRPAPHHPWRRATLRRPR